jgi:membrane fusion protein (multidrug efflux system)
MKKKILWVLAAAAGLLALVFLVPYGLYASSHQGTDDAKIDADVVTVTSKISERIARILVDTNQPVSKGQLLMLLDDRDERTRYDQASAAYRAQQAQTTVAGENLVLTSDQQNAQNQQNEGFIAQAQSNIAQAWAQAGAQGEQIAGARENLRKARVDLDRDEALVRSGDLARAQLDEARATYASARAKYEQTLADAKSADALIAAQRGQLEIARGKLAESGAPSRLRAQRAQVLAANAQAGFAAAQLKEAADQLSYTKIFSPVDGYVGEKNVEVGQTASPGMSLFSLVPSRRIYVTAKYKETQLGKMRVGMPVDITVDAYHGATFHGRVETISPASDNTFSLIPAQNATANFVKVTQRVPVRIVFENPDPAYALRPGMSVETYVDVRP